MILATMFERYNVKSRKVIFLSRVLAGELGGGAIEPEHLLLAILQEDPELGGWLDSETARDGVEKSLKARVRVGGGAPASGEVRLGAGTRRVLELAEKDVAGEAEIGPGDLLAAILRVDGGAAAALREFGREPVKAGREAKFPAKMVFLAGTNGPHDGGPADTRDLHRLVDLLPRSQMARAKALLAALVAAGSGTT